MIANLLQRDRAGEVAVHPLPVMVGPIVGQGFPHVPAAATTEELTQIRKLAYSDAYSQAYAKASREAHTDYARRAAQFKQICDGLVASLATVDDEVVECVAELAVLIARHLVRRELKTNPGEVIGVVREAMRQLPLATRHARIHLHPEDVALVQQALNLGTESGWQLEADPLLTRGGCIVDTESSRIDAQVESRVAAIASKMFGGERESDRVR